MADLTVFLRRGREASLLRRHPWVFTGAIDRVTGEPARGETVEVRAADGRWLARGAWSPASQIRVRIWTFDEDEAVDRDFLLRRVQFAVGHRQADPWLAETDSWRVVNSESDGLPGVIVDRYVDTVVFQLLSAGAEYWRDAIIEVLEGVLRPRTLHERSDTDVRRKEGLQPRRGHVSGTPLEGPVLMREGEVRYAVDCIAGHKTGFYLDQRANRAIMDRLAGGGRVLNAFSYTGGFGVRALTAGAASVTHIDSSADALERARENSQLNGHDPARIELLCGNAFEQLRALSRADRRFDVVILDPPRFVSSTAQLRRGARGYKDINLQALALLPRGGWLATFSCSGLVEPRLFQKIVADAALDAGRVLDIVHWLHADGDHPVRASFPEGQYLKGLLCRVG